MAQFLKKKQPLVTFTRGNPNFVIALITDIVALVGVVPLRDLPQLLPRSVRADSPQEHESLEPEQAGWDPSWRVPVLFQKV